jgi:hypothetical protein
MISRTRGSSAITKFWRSDTRNDIAEMCDTDVIPINLDMGTGKEWKGGDDERDNPSCHYHLVYSGGRASTPHGVEFREWEYQPSMFHNLIYQNCSATPTNSSIAYLIVKQCG